MFEVPQSYLQAQEDIGGIIASSDKEFSRISESFVESRLGQLADTDVSIPASLHVFSEPFDGFIPEDTEIRPRAVFGNGIVIDDRAIYRQFMAMMRLFGGRVDLTDQASYREAVLFAAQYGQGYYFDSDMPQSERANALAIRDNLINHGPDGRDGRLSIVDLKGVAYCTEIAAVSHNLLHFAGSLSIYLTGLATSSDGQFLHCFQLVPTTEDTVDIFDPTNPFRYRRQDESRTSFIIPALYRGGEGILEGDVVELYEPRIFKHQDFSKQVSQLVLKDEVRARGRLSKFSVSKMSEEFEKGFGGYLEAVKLEPDSE